MSTVTIESAYSTEKQLIEIINSVLKKNHSNDELIKLPKNIQSIIDNSDIYIEEYDANIDVSLIPINDYAASSTFTINKLNFCISSYRVHSMEFSTDDDCLIMYDD